LAKTLVHDPPVLILDEPASGLDPRARIEVKALLKELRSMGKTILISSHILTELADCCTSIGIMEKGKLLAHGSIASIYRQVRKNRVIDIHFLSNMEVGLSVVRSFPQLRSLEVNGKKATAEFQMRDEEVAELLEQLLKKDVKLLTFHDREPTLEDVFMSVTEGLVT
ncbi:MAG: DUF4162 domain-containing protein, partial [Planctomycetota bacterium]|nr:DUF4162 domain-containing protein [Planctomycetota bacterium]